MNREEVASEGPARGGSVLELAALFFRLGATAFGGPAAHIALMRREVVERRKWLDDATFLDLLGATNLIPGPNSTEMAIHIGWLRHRWIGLFAAGLAFITPAMVMTGAAAYVYTRYHTLPSAEAVLYGIKPVMVAVVLQAIGSLWPRAARTWGLRLLGVGTAATVFCGVDEIVALFGAGAAWLFVDRFDTKPHRSLFFAAPTLMGLTGATGMPGVGVSLGSLFWVFLKTGSVLFGSGYVLLAFLRNDLVERLGWISESQLLDAVAVGQVTPGPVFTTATFIGYLVLGPSGALVATVGIFLPAFVFVAASGPLVPRLRASRHASTFLDGINVASLALMAVVTLELGRAAIVDAPSALLCIASAVLLMRFRLNATWLIAGGAALGWVVRGFT